MPRKASSPSGKRYFSYPQARKGTICHTLTPTTHRTSKFSVLVFTSHFWRRQQKMNATSFVAVSKNEMWRTNRIHSLLQTYPQPWSSENLLRCGWCTADWAQWRYTSWVESTNAILLSKICPPLKITSPLCSNDKGSFSLSIVKEIVLTMVTEVTFLCD